MSAKLMSSSVKLFCDLPEWNKRKLAFLGLLSGIDNGIISSSGLQENPNSLNSIEDPRTPLWNGSILLESSIGWGSQDFVRVLKTWKNQMKTEKYM